MTAYSALGDFSNKAANASEEHKKRSGLRQKDNSEISNAIGRFDFFRTLYRGMNSLQYFKLQVQENKLTQF